MQCQQTMYVCIYLFTTLPHPHGHWQLQESLKNLKRPIVYGIVQVHRYMSWNLIKWQSPPFSNFFVTAESSCLAWAGIFLKCFQTAILPQWCPLQTMIQTTIFGGDVTHVSGKTPVTKRHTCHGSIHFDRKWFFYAHILVKSPLLSRFIWILWILITGRKFPKSNICYLEKKLLPRWTSIMPMFPTSNAPRQVFFFSKLN